MEEKVKKMIKNYSMLLAAFVHSISIFLHYTLFHKLRFSREFEALCVYLKLRTYFYEAFAYQKAQWMLYRLQKLRCCV
ncbi:unnamed protein product [Cylicocyclus nassatus]|uniref:Uncharacterized protein n=1 Tax=Cylicocyclus nassatus TaxID=53992 RepID=A0AA36GF04_CYLNA|nr:unnamed protein product [Cylicocyclus nassatus]